GPRGTPLALAIAKAGQAMRAVVIDELLPVANEATRTNPDLLREFTIHESVANTVLEGIQAVESAVAIAVSSERTQLSDTDLLRALAKSRLVNQMAYSPLAFIGPMNTFGVLPRESVELTSKGELEFTEGYRELRDQARSQMMMNSAHLRATGRGCPFAKGQPGQASLVSKLSEQFLELVQRFYILETQ
ncbi:MAG: hypothetical protein AAFQ82_28530, partial [Myxococcota bacterium]